MRWSRKTAAPARSGRCALLVRRSWSRCGRMSRSSVKRLHDIGRPGIIALSLFIPVVSIVAFIALCLFPGNPGPEPVRPAHRTRRPGRLRWPAGPDTSAATAARSPADHRDRANGWRSASPSGFPIAGLQARRAPNSCPVARPRGAAKALEAPIWWVRILIGLAIVAGAADVPVRRHDPVVRPHLEPATPSTSCRASRRRSTPSCWPGSASWRSIRSEERIKRKRVFRRAAWRCAR